MYLPEGVAILNCSGGQRNVFFRGVESLLSSLTRIRMYLPEGVAILNGSGGKRNAFFRGVAMMSC